MPSEEEEEFAACSVIVVSDVFSLLVFVAGLNFWVLSLLESVLISSREC